MKGILEYREEGKNWIIACHGARGLVGRHSSVWFGLAWLLHSMKRNVVIKDSIA